MALVVVTGGARSGKSGAAQRVVEQRSARSGATVVVAVFGSAEGDPEMMARIERHRADRPDTFVVIEAADPLSWMSEVPAGSILLLDCLGTLTARAMVGDTSESALDEVLATVTSWLSERDGDSVVVTNEVGSGIVPAYQSGRVFRDVLGRANSALVSAADSAYLAVAGRLLDLRTLPSDIEWPHRREPR